MRTLYISFWLYYIPFLAMTFNFTIPFLQSKYKEYFGVAGDPVAGNMSSEYEEWIASQLANSGASDYIEPTTEELVAMMEAIPPPKEGWVTNPAITVTPMSLEKYWECYWSDEAPYLVPTIIRDPEDTLEVVVPWGYPSPG